MGLVWKIPEFSFKVPPQPIIHIFQWSSSAVGLGSYSPKWFCTLSMLMIRLEIYVRIMRLVWKNVMHTLTNCGICYKRDSITAIMGSLLWHCFRSGINENIMNEENKILLRMISKGYDESLNTKVQWASPADRFSVIFC